MSVRNKSCHHFRIRVLLVVCGVLALPIGSANADEHTHTVSAAYEHSGDYYFPSGESEPAVITRFGLPMTDCEEHLTTIPSNPFSR